MIYIDKHKIGRNIKETAAAHGLTLVKLADKLEIDKGRLYNYTKGLCAPSCITLFRIAKELGVTMDSLMDGAEKNDEK